MNHKKIGMVVALAVLIVMAVPATANSIARYDPPNGEGTTGDWAWVTYYLDIEAGVDCAGGQQTIIFDPDVIDITLVRLNCARNPPTGPNQYCWGNWAKNETYTDNGYVWSFGTQPQHSEYDPGLDEWSWVNNVTEGIIGPATVELATYRVHVNDIPGVSPLNFGFEKFPPECPICQPTMVWNFTTALLPTDWQNGTFTHIGLLEPFEKDLVPGWNLISLPLTPEDNSTSAVLSSISGKYDAVFRYDATVNVKQFEVVTDGTMDPGIGYFVNVTTAGTWSYTGSYTSISVDLKPGLNCIGWGNTSEDISDALSPISGNYTYVARWDADDPKYEVYDANAPLEFIDFETMERGKGYWIAAKEGYTLNV